MSVEGKSMSIKAFLLGPHGRNTKEVRRFGVPENVATNFSYLNQRVLSVFGLGEKKKIDILWEDSDNDRIIISSDDELLEAIAETMCKQQQQLLKLYIIPKKEDIFEVMAPSTHFGIVCDGCDGEIEGHRFKCTVCPDYDLCETCNGKKIHPNHKLQDWGLPHSRLNTLRNRNRLIRKEMNDTCKMEKDFDAKCGMNEEFGRPFYHRNRRGVRNNWAGRARRACNMNEAEEQPSTSQCNHEFNARRPPMNFSECFDQFFPEEVRKNIEEAGSIGIHEIMKNIWGSWAGAFEPMGDAPQQQQKKAENSPSKEQPKPNSSNEKPKSNEKIINIEMEDSGATKASSNVEDKGGKANEDASKEEIIKSTETLTQKEQSMEVDDAVRSETPSGAEEWTLVSDETKKTSPEDDEISIDDDIQVISNSQEGMYPSISSLNNEPPKAVEPQAAAAAAAASVPVVPTHQVPAIDTNHMITHSLNHMKAMGYSDEGGWLTSLITMKKGDINQVLDVLMGPRKN